MKLDNYPKLRAIIDKGLSCEIDWPRGSEQKALLDNIGQSIVDLLKRKHKYSF